MRTSGASIAIVLVLLLVGCSAGSGDPSGTGAASASAAGPSAAPAATATPAPPSTAATLAPTPTATTEPSPTATAAASGLNYSLPAINGSTALTAGFVPDPFSVAITAGGPENANYLGGGCNGYTTAAPSFSVNYTSGSATLLRFYFIGSGDTTIIINTPGTDYVCVDDSYGTLNPTIDFNSPSGGRYDVWVASYQEGGSIGGSVYVTELSGNHP